MLCSVSCQIFLLLLLTVGCSKPKVEKPFHSITSRKPSYSFVLISKRAEVQQTSQDTFELILEDKNMEKILAFSDRPYCLVRYETENTFKSMWSASRRFIWEEFSQCHSNH